MPRVIRKQPGRRVKRKFKDSESTAESTQESSQFNMIGDLISNYGMTGENVAHQIFSQFDFSSLQQGQLVCKTWNRFLANDRNLILNLLMKTKPYLEYLSKELSDSRKEDSAVWKELFDSIPKNWWIREASNLINYLYHLPWKLRWSFVARLTDSKMGILVKKIVINFAKKNRQKIGQKIH